MTNFDLDEINQSDGDSAVECSRSNQSDNVTNLDGDDLKQVGNGTDLKRHEANNLIGVDENDTDSGDVDTVRSANNEECETMLTTKNEDDQGRTNQLPKNVNGSVVSSDQSNEDGGYGWVVMICSLCVFMMYGANYVMFSVYIVDFSEVLDKPQAYIGVIGSVDTAMSMFTALPAGAFVSLYGCRPVCITGLLIYTIGTLISAFSTNFYTLLLTFGFLKGLGAGTIFIPCSVIVQQYFKRRRALAVAFSTSGLSLGTMIFSPVHRFLIRTFGWRGGLIFFSGVVLQCVVFAALMRPPNLKNKLPSVPAKRDSAEGFLSKADDVSRRKSVVQSAWMVLGHFQKALRVAYLKNLKMLFFLSMKTFSVTGIITVYKFCIARAVHLGINKFYASFLITAIGTNSCLFRWIGGFIGNLRCTNRLIMYTFSTMLAGLMIVLSVIVSNDFYVHLAFYLIYGAFLGMGEGMYPVIATDLFGIERLPSTLGWVMAFTGIMVFVYMPLFGFLFDLTQSYTVPYLLGGTIQVVASSMGFVIMYLNRREKRQQVQQEL